MSDYNLHIKGLDDILITSGDYLPRVGDIVNLEDTEMSHGVKGHDGTYHVKKVEHNITAHSGFNRCSDIDVYVSKKK